MLLHVIRAGVFCSLAAALSSVLRLGQWSDIGVSQVGNTITFASFTNNTFDQSSPVDQITYTLSQ